MSEQVKNVLVFWCSGVLALLRDIRGLGYGVWRRSITRPMCHPPAFPEGER